MVTIKGGDKLEKALAEIAAKVKNGATVRVGFLENAKYPDGTPVAMVAAIQDGGAPSIGIPPRPFFRNMVAEKKEEWPKAIAENLKANDYDVEKTLDQVGEGIAGQLRESIQQTNSPPLSETTVERKGFEKPLVDTGHMLDSVDHDVKKS